MAEVKQEEFSFDKQKQCLQQELADILSMWTDKKLVLILDSTISPLLAKTVGMSFLTEKGVREVHLLDAKTSPVKLVTQCEHALYMIRPDIATVDSMCVQVIKTRHDMDDAKDAQNGTLEEFTCFFIPRRSILCEEAIEKHGLHGIIKTSQFELDLVPMEPDVASFELSTSFRDCYLHADRTVLHRIASSLSTLQMNFGYIPEIIGKGRCSQVVNDMLEQMTQDNKGQLGTEPSIHKLILFDREIDPLTPLLSQLTYEGVIDEIIGIQCGAIKIDSSVIYSAGDKDAKDEQKQVKFPLRSDDPVYANIRDRNFGAVLSLFAQNVTSVKDKVDKRHEAQSVRQLHAFTQALPDILKEKKSLTHHVNLSQYLTTFTESADFEDYVRVENDLLEKISRTDARSKIEGLIIRHAPITKVLRLLCVYSLVYGGLKTKHFDFFRDQILQTYGYSQLLTLYNLEKVGLLVEHSSEQIAKFDFSRLAKVFHLVASVDEASREPPIDICYAFSTSGYAPLSIRIIDSILRQGDCKTVDKHFRYQQSFHRVVPHPTGKNYVPPSNPTTLVYFIGGVTYAEISTLRFLQNKWSQSGEKEPRDRILIATSKLINGNTMISNLGEVVKGGTAPGFPM